MTKVGFKANKSSTTANLNSSFSSQSVMRLASIRSEYSQPDQNSDFEEYYDEELGDDYEED